MGKIKQSRILTPPQLIEYDGEIVGYGSPELRVETISCWLARTVICAKHYSKRIVNNSYLHLGVFSGRELVGVMQWGYALNPNSGARVVTGTGNREYMELNRLWLHDNMPRNSESRAISYALKAIKQLYPSVQWVQSFADERCGRFGVVYQASNFDYVGATIHASTSWMESGITRSPPTPSNAVARAVDISERIWIGQQFIVSSSSAISDF